MCSPGSGARAHAAGGSARPSRGLRPRWCHWETRNTSVASNGLTTCTPGLAGAVACGGRRLGRVVVRQPWVRAWHAGAVWKAAPNSTRQRRGRPRYRPPSWQRMRGEDSPGAPGGPTVRAARAWRDPRAGKDSAAHPGSAQCPSCRHPARTSRCFRHSFGQSLRPLQGVGSYTVPLPSVGVRLPLLWNYGLQGNTGIVP